MFTSLRARLIVSYIVIILICLALVSLASVFLLSRFQATLVYMGLREAAVPTAYQVYRLLQQDLMPEEIVKLLEEQAEKQELRILLLTPRGQVLADTQGNWTGKQAKVDLDETLKDPKLPYIRGRLTTPGGDTQLYVALQAAPLRLAAESGESQRSVFVALLTSPRRGFRTILKDIAPRFLQAGLVTLLISIILASIKTCLCFSSICVIIVVISGIFFVRSVTTILFVLSSTCIVPTPFVRISDIFALMSSALA